MLETAPKFPADVSGMQPGNGHAIRPAGGILTIDALDRRTRPYRRYEAIRGAVLSDLGGEQNISEVQRQLIAKFATLALQLEAMEATAIEGGEINLDVFGRCAGHLRRLAESIGLRRVPRDVETLEQYLATAQANEPLQDAPEDDSEAAQDADGRVDEPDADAGDERSDDDGIEEPTA